MHAEGSHSPTMRLHDGRRRQVRHHPVIEHKRLTQRANGLLFTVFQIAKHGRDHQSLDCLPKPNGVCKYSVPPECRILQDCRDALVLMLARVEDFELVLVQKVGLQRRRVHLLPMLRVHFVWQLRVYRPDVVEVRDAHHFLIYTEPLFHRRDVVICELHDTPVTLLRDPIILLI